MNNKKLKVVFLVGEIPTTTFINRLAEGLVKSNVEVMLYGLIKSKIKLPEGVFFSGAKDGKNEGRYGRLKQFLRYSFLLSVFRPKQKKRIDQWLQKKGKKALG